MCGPTGCTESTRRTTPRPAGSTDSDQGHLDRELLHRTSRRPKTLGKIAEGLERLVRTRPAPTSTADRLKFLLKSQKGSTKRLAALLGVSQRTVQRWVTAKAGVQGHPSPAHARVIEDVVRIRWQPRVRARIQAQAEARGIVLHARARFGFSSAAGSSDDPRQRLITQELSGAVARELFAARDAGAGERQQVVILARALGHAYFRDWGRRAHGLQITFSDIEFADFITR
ncbi:telomere-protecting terminal protein Tpg [Streptomyces sp. NPDC005498]|uniref:telomere-protecting terminal protein Tpg n=1 Tax=Streptomyces sp. NPDC005498 TaxID=3364717 RepID=UPI0036C5E56B